MANESKGVALAILGIVAVIAVVGLVLLFKGATGKVVDTSMTFPNAKVYGGALKGEQYPNLVKRAIGFPNGPASPGGYDSSIEGTVTEDQLPFQGSELGGTFAPRTAHRGIRNIPSSQSCAAGSSDPGYGCPQGTTCIAEVQVATGGGWVAVDPVNYPGCYVRAGSSRALASS
jgi:hypothetical protein